MTVQDTLNRERRFLARLLDRLESCFAVEERRARLDSANLLLLLTPCLEMHAQVDRLLYRRRDELEILQQDVRAILAHGDEVSYEACQSAVLRLVERIRARLQSEDSWRPRWVGPQASVERTLQRHLKEIVRKTIEREAAIDEYRRLER